MSTLSDQGVAIYFNIITALPPNLWILRMGPAFPPPAPFFRLERQELLSDSAIALGRNFREFSQDWRLHMAWLAHPFTVVSI